MTVNFTTWKGITDGQSYGIPDSVVDNLNDADADPPGVYEEGETLTDYYQGDTGSFARTTDAEEGSHALEKTSDTTRENIYSLPGNDLNRYLSEGDTIGFLMRGTDANPAVLFNVEDASNPGCYAAAISPTADYLRIYRFGDLTDPDNTETQLAESTDLTVSSGTSYWAEVDPPTSTDDEILFEFYDLEDDLTRGSLLDSVTANDDTYAAEPGVGWMGRGASAGRIGDWYRIID